VSRCAALTLYVRRPSDPAYTALYLETPTLAGLTRQLGARLGIAAEQIQQVYKRTRKGLLVAVDDAVVARTRDEDDYVVDVTPKGQGYVVVMTPGDGVE
jgi:hypothetical protein